MKEEYKALKEEYKAARGQARQSGEPVPLMFQISDLDDIHTQLELQAWFSSSEDEHAGYEVDALNCTYAGSLGPSFHEFLNKVRSLARILYTKKIHMFGYAGEDCSSHPVNH